MGTILAFPTPAASGRGTLERDIRAGLADQGLSAELIDEITGNLRDFITVLSSTTAFPFPVPDGIPVEFAAALTECLQRGAEAGLESFIDRLVVERCHREVDFIAGRHRGI